MRRVIFSCPVQIVRLLTVNLAVVLTLAPSYPLPMPTLSVLAGALLIISCAGILFCIAKRQVRSNAFDRAETEKVVSRRIGFPLTAASELRDRALGKPRKAKGKAFKRYRSSAS